MGCHFPLQGIFLTQGAYVSCIGRRVLYHWATREALRASRRRLRRAGRLCGGGICQVTDWLQTSQNGNVGHHAQQRTHFAKIASKSHKDNCSPRLIKIINVWGVGESERPDFNKNLQSIQRHTHTGVFFTVEFFYVRQCGPFNLIYFCLHFTACEILGSWPEIEPVPTAMEAQSPNC